MAAPAYKITDFVDREGLTPDEYHALNELWEEPDKREKAFAQMMHAAVRPALEEWPNVLVPLVVQYLSAPLLPPSLQAALQAKAQLAMELDSLLARQQTLVPALEQAQASAGERLAARLSQRE